MFSLHGHDEEAMMLVSSMFGDERWSEPMGGFSLAEKTLTLVPSRCRRVEVKVLFYFYDQRCLLGVKSFV